MDESLTKVVEQMRGRHFAVAEPNPDLHASLFIATSETETTDKENKLHRFLDVRTRQDVN